MVHTSDVVGIGRKKLRFPFRFVIYRLHTFNNTNRDVYMGWDVDMISSFRRNHFVWLSKYE